MMQAAFPIGVVRLVELSAIAINETVNCFAKTLRIELSDGYNSH
jgi:hypothetical protein